MKKSKKILICVFIFLIAFIILIMIINISSKNNQEIDNNGDQLEVNEEVFTISGEFVCLPVKDENKFHNDLCAFGIKTDDNEYYRLQSISDDKFNLIAQLNNGQRVEISGLLIKEESDVYKSLGTIEINIVKTLDNEQNIDLPNGLRADYISFQNYSLGIFNIEDYNSTEFEIKDNEIECTETDLSLSLPFSISKREINNKKYCISASSEGAAGSVYTEYSYATVIENKVYSIKFIAHYPQCDNYPEEESAKCKKERESFNLNGLIDKEIELIKGNIE
jgi:preprotein translocase subunit YajC